MSSPTAEEPKHAQWIPVIRRYMLVSMNHDRRFHGDEHNTGSNQ